MLFNLWSQYQKLIMENVKDTKEKKMNIERKLKALIVDITTEKVDNNSIDTNTDLINDLGFDSIEIIELIVEIENEFKIEIDDDDINMNILTTYSELLSMIERKLQN